MNKLSKDFFASDPELVAKNLLGKLIIVGNKKGIITETEAYKGSNDEASHAFGGKTKRNLLMYETYGYVYVYLIYGMHYCLNFTADKNNAGAVLIRGVIDVSNIGLNNLKKGNFISGPGRTTKFFGIDNSFNGLDLSETDKIQVFDVGLKFDYEQTSRIGIKKALDKKWRFVIKKD